MIPRAAILPPRATMDDLAAGTPVSALATPLLDAACLSDADELRRVVPVDERTRYAAMRERAEAAESYATGHEGALKQSRETARRLLEERDAALRLLAEVWRRVQAREQIGYPSHACYGDGCGGCDLGERVEAALSAAGLLDGTRDTAPTAADFAAMAGLPDDRCPHCGLGADLCPRSTRDDCAIVNSLPTHGEVMELPGHEAAERREHLSEPPTIPAHCDVPLCGCVGPLVLREEHHRGVDYADPVRLICLNCGEGRIGSDADVAKAMAARAAWEEKLRAEDGAS